MRAAALLLALSACGSNGLESADRDLASASDDLSATVSGRDSGALICGSAGTCEGGLGCCVRSEGDAGTVPSCAASCDGGVAIECTGPGYCSGNPCCLLLDRFKPKSVTCTSTPSACPPQVDFSGAGMTRLCDQDGDCTAGAPDTILPECCHNTQSGVKVCFASAYIRLTKGAILCP